MKKKTQSKQLILYRKKSEKNISAIIIETCWKTLEQKSRVRETSSATLDCSNEHSYEALTRAGWATAAGRRAAAAGGRVPVGMGGWDWGLELPQLEQSSSVRGRHFVAAWERQHHCYKRDCRNIFCCHQKSVLTVVGGRLGRCQTCERVARSLQVRFRCCCCSSEWSDGVGAHLWRGGAAGWEDEGVKMGQSLFCFVGTLRHRLNHAHCRCSPRTSMRCLDLPASPSSYAHPKNKTKHASWNHFVSQCNDL